MEIKLIYFDMPFWRAEVARLPLFLSNIEFEDFRITSDDNRYLKEHGKLKDKTIIPFRQLPVLVVNGQSIAQGSTENTSLEVSVEALKPGMYFIRFQNEVRTWVKQ